MSRGALKVFSEAIASLFLQSSLKDPPISYTVLEVQLSLGNGGGQAFDCRLFYWLSGLPREPHTRTHPQSSKTTQ